MERIINQNHPKSAYSLISAKFFGAMFYYSLRSLLFLFMLREVANMDQKEALKLYDWFIGSLLISGIIGALLGDLVLGNRKSVIIGGIFQILGAFSLCFNTSLGLYSGLLLITLGYGLYSPNITSIFGKQYLTKTKLLTSAYSLFFTIGYIGAFFGALISLVLVFDGVVKLGFIINTVFMIISLFFFLYFKDNTGESQEEVDLTGFDVNVIDDKTVFIDQKKAYTTMTLKQRILMISGALLLISIFWALFDQNNQLISQISTKFDTGLFFGISDEAKSKIAELYMIPLGIIFFIIWSYYYSNTLIKLSIAFFLCAFGLGLLSVIPNTPTDKFLALYLIETLFMALSEVYLSPVINTLLTKHMNTKYLSIMLAVVNLSIRCMTYLTTVFSHLYTIWIGISIMSLLGSFILFFYFFNRKKIIINNI